MASPTVIVICGCYLDLCILAIEQIAHGLAPCFVRFFHALTLEGIHFGLGCLFRRFGLAASRTSISETGLVWF